MDKQAIHDNSMLMGYGVPIPDSLMPGGERACQNIPSWAEAAMPV